MQINIKDIEKDEDIYPRQEISHKTIEGYREAIQIGASFPSIIVQRILDKNGKEHLICIDGLHRMEAFRLEKKTMIEGTYWKLEVLEKVKWLTQLQLESARLNSIHGDRLTREDKRNQARKICEHDVKITEQEIADNLGVPRQTISDWIKDIRLRQTAKGDSLIQKLHLLGWTQQEIALIFGVTQGAISQKLLEMPISAKLIKTLLNQGDSVEKIAEKLSIDIQLAWAIALDGKTDEERFDIFGRTEYSDKEPVRYNVWNFVIKDPRLGIENYLGRIEGQIILNLLYYYTKQGDLIVDPMAGSGTTNDACLIMGRKCLSYDINPIRKDIKKIVPYSILPNETKGCNLIFLDPPYWRLIPNYPKESLSNLPLKEFLEYFEKLAKDCHEKLIKDGKVALLMQSFYDRKTEKAFLDLSFEITEIFLRNGFKEIQRISFPINRQTIEYQDLEYGIKNKILLDVNRDLVILEMI